MKELNIFYRLYCVYLLYLIVEENHSELTDVIDNVGCWWTEFETVRSKVMEMREELTEARPLGGSVPVVQTQDEEVQV